MKSGQLGRTSKCRVEIVGISRTLEDFKDMLISRRENRLN